MAKVANTYLKVDPYMIIESGFHKDRSQVSESLFSISNEYCGIRGCFDEGVSALPTLRGSYFNGIYDYALEKTNNAYKGIVERTHFMINSVDWIALELFIAGEKLDLSVNQISKFKRTLDFRSGELVRSFIYEGKDNLKVRLVFKRLVSMKHCQEAFQVLSLENLSDRSLPIHLTFILNSRVKHWGKDCYWKKWFTKQEDDGSLALGARTLSTKQSLVSRMKIQSSVPLEPQVSLSDMSLNASYDFTLDPLKTTSFARYVVNVVNRHKGEDLSDDSLLLSSKQDLEESFKGGYETALKDNLAFFADFYKRSDIVIKGSNKDQQGIRFCLFQLAQTYHGYSPYDNIGAKGLTGEAYSGHAFWDSETYCLPFYLLNNLEAAKDLLMFRYSTLPQARARAKMLDCGGACYPVATLNGEEGCNLWQHASLQFQPSTGVAYAIFHYFNLTKDEAFMKQYGLEMLLEISHFLLDRGQYDNSGKHFGYYAVMGPDEFKMMVNNNTYTNFMAKETFVFTLKMMKQYGNEKTLEKLGLHETFLHNIKMAAKRMIILYNPKTHLYEQNEGFFKLPHLDVDKIPVTDFPLYSHWTYDRIYRYDMIKQPDVLMFLFLYNSSFSIEDKKANYEYYEPRCIHESSLSPSIHSILAIELGKEKEADKFFDYATRLDLDDYNRNTSEGLHITSLAAAYMNIVYGYGGLRSDGPILSLNPKMPKKWHSYSFSFLYRGAQVKVFVSHDYYEIKSDKPVRLRLDNHLKTIKGTLSIKR